MHFHCEIIMPSSNNIEKSIAQIMRQFDENTEDPSGNEFWDFWIIGGRWAGTKETCRYDADKIEDFYKELQNNKVTVSGIQCGKQKLEPESQIPFVDKLWNKYFPTEDGTITPCPLFSHSNNQYDNNDLLSCDICRVDEIPENLTCSRVIIAGPSWCDDGSLEAKYILVDKQWNGCNHMPIDWDGYVKSAINKFMDEIKLYQKEYAKKITPKPNWICVTVDYHS